MNREDLKQSITGGLGDKAMMADDIKLGDLKQCITDSLDDGDGNG